MLLRNGGILVYATCSLEPEENEHQVGSFLDRHPEFETAPFPNGFPKAFLPAEETGGRLISLPGEREGFDGGFAARLRKRELA
jgi:16S rRNA (cytosine967-C5)-methyltransferase